MNLALGYALVGVATALLIARLTRHAPRPALRRIAGAIVCGLAWPVVIVAAVMFVSIEALEDAAARWMR